MDGKKISVVIKTSPFKNAKAVEAMRLSVGLTIRIPQVHLIFLGEGLNALKGEQIKRRHELDFMKHLKTFIELGLPLIVEKESLADPQDVFEDLDLKVWSRDRIITFLSQCDAVVYL